MHTSQYPKLPLKITRFELPDDTELYFEPAPEKLPEGWQTIPPDRPSMAFGTKWLLTGKYLGLIVPSAVLPLERNIVINPNHPAIDQVRLGVYLDVMYDERMFLR